MKMVDMYGVPAEAPEGLPVVSRWEVAIYAAQECVCWCEERVRRGMWRLESLGGVMAHDGWVTSDPVLWDIYEKERRKLADARVDVAHAKAELERVLPW